MKTTDIFQFVYVDEGDILPPEIEASRWTKLDRQMFALYELFGNGIIEGWELYEGEGLSIVVSSGRGHINYMSARTNNAVAITDLKPYTQYGIYAQRVYSAAFIESVEFVFSETPQISTSLVFLGTVTTGETGIDDIDMTDREDISYIASFRSCKST